MSNAATRFRRELIDNEDGLRERLAPQIADALVLLRGAVFTDESHYWGCVADVLWVIHMPAALAAAVWVER